MTMNNPLPNDRDRFRQISKSEYEALDDKMKLQLAQTRHTAILNTSEEHIYKQLMSALTQPTTNEDGTQGPPMRLEDIVVLLINRDEPFVEGVFPELQEICARQDVFVAVFAVFRQKFAQSLGSWKPKGAKYPPYGPAAKALMTPPGDGLVYFCVMDTWQCQVIKMGFDPNAQPEPPPAAESAAPA